MKKINGKVILIAVIWLLVICLLVYSRFINLGWGLPYPMHPDERNMGNALQQLQCKFPIRQLADCFNPHFFAYGQFPLYLGYLLIWILKGFRNFGSMIINFEEAVMSLRIISAIVSIINVFVLVKIVELFYLSKSKSFRFTLGFALYVLIFTFSPYAIQFSHFGTTESLLMMFYSTIIYFSLLLIDKKIDILSFILNSSILVGLSLATKVSSLTFLIVPFSVLLFNKHILKHKTSTSTFKNLIFFVYKLVNKIIYLSILVCLSLIVFVIFSPHNFINLKDFLSSMTYESDVALGKSLVFYTRQFFNTEPLYFQLTKVFPYVLGWATFFLGGLGIIGLSWKDKKINLLRFAFLIYFIPNAMIYAKWSRFMTPVLPLIPVFAILFLESLIFNFQFLFKFKLLKFISNFLILVITLIMLLPGLAYLSVYQNTDVRFQASKWIYKNIPNGSFILFETANVVDIPIVDQRIKIKDQKVFEKNYQTVSFNFYDLDQSPELQLDLKNYIEKADYIFVPSRRLFANHTCYGNNNSIKNNKCQILKQKYPILNQYYDDLFNGELGFEKVAEFESYPKICLPFSNKCLILKDEQAEETWTVFDHPVIRIYKKIKSF